MPPFGAAVAVAVGLPALRVRGLYLGVTTFAFALATTSYLPNRQFFDWPRGMYRYVDDGARYLPGEWPEGETKAFEQQDSVVIYEDLPEDERPPDYPSPAEGG